MAISASACLDVYHRRITTDEAKGDALDHLAMDATESEIISYLDGRGYSHTEASAAGTETYLASAGVSPETLVIRGFIPDSSRSLLIEGHTFCTSCSAEIADSSALSFTNASKDRNGTSVRPFAMHMRLGRS